MRRDEVIIQMAIMAHTLRTVPPPRQSWNCTRLQKLRPKYRPTTDGCEEKYELNRFKKKNNEGL